MNRCLVYRLLQGVVLLCLVATIVFFLGRLTGNPVDLMLPEYAATAERAAMIKALGLDGSLFHQFTIFVGNALHGDLGTSIRMRQPAVEAFFSRLPNITLGAFLVAGFMRLVRSSMLEVMESELVKLARIKGLSESVVIWKHCLRNALIPVLTLWGVFVGNLITGAIVTETVFAWPGVGRLTYEAVIFRDFPLLQAVIILKAILILGINLFVD